MSNKGPATHCDKCGVSYEVVRRFYGRRVCRKCGLAEQHLRQRRLRQENTSSLFKPGERLQDTADAKKFVGQAKILRERRLARYRLCVELGVPIAFEPRDEF